MGSDVQQDQIHRRPLHCTATELCNTNKQNTESVLSHDAVYANCRWLTTNQYHFIARRWRQPSTGDKWWHRRGKSSSLLPDQIRRHHMWAHIDPSCRSSVPLCRVSGNCALVPSLSATLGRRLSLRLGLRQGFKRSSSVALRPESPGIPVLGCPAGTPRGFSARAVRTIRPLNAIGVSLIREPNSHIALLPVMCGPSGHSAELLSR